MIRRYRDLAALTTLEDRYAYLKLGAAVGDVTFGHERWMNQRFYTSSEWKNVRHHIIARDLGCDLGIRGHEVFGRIYIHHMNPMTVEDIRDGNDDILNPEYLIAVSHRTHNAIHYGDQTQLPQPITDRRPGDTILWNRMTKG